jgi:hypothetical protein
MTERPAEQQLDVRSDERCKTSDRLVEAENAYQLGGTSYAQ